MFLGAARKALHRKHIGGYVEDAATPRAVFRGADFPCELLNHPTSLAIRMQLRRLFWLRRRSARNQ